MPFVDSPIFTMLIIVGPIFTIMGLLLFFFPPKRINYFYGYRTFRSFASQKAWNAAQPYSARIITGGGLVLMAIGLLSTLFPAVSADVGMSVGLVVIGIVLVYMFVKTEVMLKRLLRNEPKEHL